jgi:hypothetical protein
MGHVKHIRPIACSVWDGVQVLRQASKRTHCGRLITPTMQVISWKSARLATCKQCLRQYRKRRQRGRTDRVYRRGGR